MKNCPYCGGKVTPPKVKKWETPPFAHGQCTECPRKPRAKITWNNKEQMGISYSRDGRKPMSPYDRKRNVSFPRLSERDLADIEAGRKTLTVQGGRVILIA